MRAIVLVLACALAALTACTNDYGAFRFDSAPAITAGAAGAAGAAGSAGSTASGAAGAAGAGGG